MAAFLTLAILLSTASWSAETEKKKPVPPLKSKLEKTKGETPPPPPKDDPTQGLMEPAPAPLPDID